MILLGEITKAVKLLTFINSNSKELNFPNVQIVYITVLTILVTVTCTERGFSKLKLIKSYLRWTIFQKRFNGLTILSIEKDMVDEFDFESIIS